MTWILSKAPGKQIGKKGGNGIYGQYYPIANVVKFTERGQVIVCSERQGGFVRFSVRDTGCGIAGKDQGKVFDKFKQIGDTLTDKPHGTGFGLSICVTSSFFVSPHRRNLRPHKVSGTSRPTLFSSSPADLSAGA